MTRVEQNSVNRYLQKAVQPWLSNIHGPSFVRNVSHLYEHHAQLKMTEPAEMRISSEPAIRLPFFGRSLKFYFLSELENKLSLASSGSEKFKMGIFHWTSAAKWPSELKWSGKEIAMQSERCGGDSSCKPAACQATLGFNPGPKIQCRGISSHSISFSIQTRMVEVRRVKSLARNARPGAKTCAEYENSCLPLIRLY